MTTTYPKPVPAEPADGKDGLIHGLSTLELESLSDKCHEAKTTAYCPYSLFRVGASLLIHPSSPSSTSSPPLIITGANVENASYPVGTCAERVAMGNAVIQGHRLGAFKAIGVTTDLEDYCSPCGMCRQFLREFCEDTVPVFMFSKTGEYKVKTMGELLPMSFGPEKLPSREEMERKGEGRKE
ncbi:cytidine deaminase [Amniculicola lignicola CBS 123094]|uniref:Cytidine deaminase n=1 Tax=Amniculicola lignicola CBS 123094 TaxID=1392246 RepID=A0A6A5WAX1_9PLEO|nr:cytidine deaminase [Amniculicola lignicola CBS 123094]